MPFKTFFLLLVGKGIVSFERENRDLSDAVLVKETLDLVAACDRVLSKPGGSMLMCGKSGVGRRSAVSIVSALHQAKWINLKMGKKYYDFFLFNSLHDLVLLTSCKWTKISVLRITIFVIKIMMKSGLEIFILKSNEPLPICCCPMQTNLPDRLNWLSQLAAALKRLV